jgi:protease-4
VWSGVEARKLGLVDELGDLDAAIRYAAGQAGLGAGYRLVEFPKKKEFAEALAEAIERMAPTTARAPGIADRVAKRLEAEMRALRTFNDPQGIYARLPLGVTIE